MSLPLLSSSIGSAAKKVLQRVKCGPGGSEDDEKDDSADTLEEYQPSNGTFLVNVFPMLMARRSTKWRRTSQTPHVRRSMYCTTLPTCKKDTRSGSQEHRSPKLPQCNLKILKVTKDFRGTAVKLGSFRQRKFTAIAVVSAGTYNKERQYHFSDSRSANLLPRTTASHTLKPLHDARRFVANRMYCSEMAEMAYVTVPRAGSKLRSGYMKRKMDSVRQQMMERMQKSRRR
ncbi:MAG: hypothetical protein JOS17DRAFT_828859 [Linnemannia elongata]|nr:MAG: hypothetical protein JOS17DRAFT_828859 [Linnemannia elongata]